MVWKINLLPPSNFVCCFITIFFNYTKLTCGNQLMTTPITLVASTPALPTSYNCRPLSLQLVAAITSLDYCRSYVKVMVRWMRCSKWTA